MNKTQLINAIAQEANISKQDAKKSIEAFVNIATNLLKDGGKVSVVGFGALMAVDKPGRNGRNPKTGEPIKIEAKRVIKFKPGIELSDAIK